MLDQDWIIQQRRWRDSVEFGLVQEPFITPPLLDSATYLFFELVELWQEIFKTTRPEDVRNPETQRGEIMDEIGDSLLMIGTVAHQLGLTQLIRTTVTHIPVSNTQMAKQLTMLASQLHNHIELDDTASAWFSLKHIYSLLLDLAEALQIDPQEALYKTYIKIEGRTRGKQ